MYIMHEDSSYYTMKDEKDIQNYTVDPNLTIHSGGDISFSIAIPRFQSG